MKDVAVVTGGSLGIGAGTVSRYVRDLQAAGLSWPLPSELSDAAIERRLFPENYA